VERLPRPLHVDSLGMKVPTSPNNAINADVQKRRFALFLYAGYGERYVVTEIRRMMI